MGTKRAAEIVTATNQNILLAIDQQNTTRNAVAIKAGVPSTTFERKLNRPGKFTLEELVQVAGALNLRLEDLVKDAA